MTHLLRFLDVCATIIGRLRMRIGYWLFMRPMQVLQKDILKTKSKTHGIDMNLKELTPEQQEQINQLIKAEPWIYKSIPPQTMTASTSLQPALNLVKDWEDYLQDSRRWIPTLKEDSKASVSSPLLQGRERAKLISQLRLLLTYVNKARKCCSFLQNFNMKKSVEKNNTFLPC